MSSAVSAEPTVLGKPATTIVPAAGCAIAGAVLFHLGQALLPSMPDNLDAAYAAMTAHRDQLMAARLATAAGAFLLAPAAVGFARLIPHNGRGRRLLVLACLLFGIATFGNGLSQAVSGYSTWAVTARGFDAAAGRAVVDTIETGLPALPLGFWSIPAFALGALLIAVALFRSGLVPVWLPVLLGVGTVLAAALAGTGLIVIVSQAPFTLALILLGLRVPPAAAPQ